MIRFNDNATPSNAGYSIKMNTKKNSIVVAKATHYIYEYSIAFAFRFFKLPFIQSHTAATYVTPYW